MGEPVILTSETPEATQAFYARRLGLDQPEPAVAAEKAEPVVESVAEKKSEPDKDAPEGESNDDVEQHVPNPEARQKVHYRFSELTEKAKAAEAKAVEAEAKALAEAKSRALAEQETAALRAKYEPPKTDPLGPKPARAQFVNDDEFSAALEDWTTDKVTRDRDQQEKASKVVRAWTERQAAVRAEIPDYDTTIAAGSDLQVSNEVRDAILESEQGPKILHHLAKNPTVVAELAAMSPEGRLRRIGKLEGKFESEAVKAKETSEPKDEKHVVAAELSRAPAPISPLRSAKATPDSPVDSKGEFHGTFEAYKAARKAGLI